MEAEVVEVATATKEAAGIVGRVSMNGAQGKNAVAPVFTDSIDGDIISGFLANRRILLRKLRNLGFRRIDIIERAKKLGLSDQFLKKCAVGKCDVAMRPCLGCNESFLSMGFQNRLCPRCRNRS